MDLHKPAVPFPKYAVGLVVAALVLLSPSFAFLMFIAAEALIDLLMAASAGAVCVVIVAAIGLALFRRFSRGSDSAVRTAATVASGRG